MYECAMHLTATEQPENDYNSILGTVASIRLHQVTSVKHTIYSYCNNIYEISKTIIIQI